VNIRTEEGKTDKGTRKQSDRGKNKRMETMRKAKNEETRGK
jgi:hypothetical protein